MHSSILTWRNPLPAREAWQATVYRVTRSRTLPKRPCMHRHKTFWPAAALSQWDLNVKVAQLLGLQGPWQCQVFRDTHCLHCRSYDPIRVFFPASCSWWSVGLFVQSFSTAPPMRVQRDPFPGFLLCCLVCQALRGVLLTGTLHCRSAHQAFKGAPWVEPYSVVCLIGHLKEHLGCVAVL